jgi:hypothetical protein
VARAGPPRIVVSVSGRAARGVGGQRLILRRYDNSPGNRAYSRHMVMSFEGFRLKMEVYDRSEER